MFSFKKNIKKGFLLFLIVFLFPLITRASFFESKMGLKETAKGTGHTKQKIFNSPGSIDSGVGMVIEIVLSLLGVIFLIFFIYSGVLWMTAGGNDERVSKAKKIMTGSIIGLIIALIAYSVSVFIIGAFSGKNLLD